MSVRLLENLILLNRMWGLKVSKYSSILFYWPLARAMRATKSGIKSIIILFFTRKTISNSDLNIAFHILVWLLFSKIITLYKIREKRMGAATFQRVYFSFILTTTIGFIHKKDLSSFNLKILTFNSNFVLNFYKSR